MSFTQYHYYGALCALVLIALFLRSERRWPLLLMFSVIFYGYGRWEYLALLLVSISIDYFCAIAIDASASKVRRKALLFASLFANLSMLLFFKYLTELYAEWAWIEERSATFGIQLDNILLPLGISFYTLQSMGYTIDVYRKEMKPERHFGYFSLYVCFFPQLVAGPIERPQKLLPQLRRPHPIDSRSIQAGLFLIGLGLLKKQVVADRLFLILNYQLEAPTDLAAWQITSFGTLAFFAIYLDISAYTDIARGSAKLFGINLSKNFNRPMLALSTGEFWRRWHITLSSWMMNYLFRPLAQLSPVRAYRHSALIFTFLVIGFWHGPTLPFVVMGLLQGVIIVLENIAARKGLRWPRTGLFNALRLLRVHIVIAVSCILFMSPDTTTALALFGNLATFDLSIDADKLSEQLGGYYSFSVMVVGAIAITVINVIYDSPGLKAYRWINESLVLRVGLLYLLFAVSIAFAERASSSFMYFFF